MDTINKVKNKISEILKDYKATANLSNESYSKLENKKENISYSNQNTSSLSSIMKNLKILERLILNDDILNFEEMEYIIDEISKTSKKIYQRKIIKKIC